MTFFPRFLVACALAVASPALAQESTDDTATSSETIANGQKFGAWTVDCVAIAVGQTNCTLTQRILRASDGAFVANVVALRDADKQTFLVASVPVGASLPTGFAMREADSEEMMQFTWQVCTPEVCETLIQLDDEQVTALSSDDNSMVAAFRPTTQSDPFIFQLSLAGMEAGLNALSE